VHHVGILYGQFMMHGQRNIKLAKEIGWLPSLETKPLEWRRSFERSTV